MYNRLVSYQADQKGKKESYSYDAEGVRRSKTASEGEEEKEILFISDTSGELSRTLAETDEEGELLASYGWGDTLLSQTREGKTSTYLYDGQGNVRGLLDEKGNLTDTYAYNAYGELTEKTGETENHYLYTGEYYDGVSGLYYLRARYMNPEMGSFTSMDTWQGDLYEPVTLHKYLYANANPVKYKDPSGMFSLPECNIASAIGAELYQNQNVILGMSLLNGIGKSVMTGLCGGDAGDMTEFGERSNVLLIRENGGKQERIRLDLNSSEVLTSPYFYLQPNDYIYVEPNKIRQDNSRYNMNNSYKLTVVSTIVSAASVIASLIIALTVK